MSRQQPFTRSTILSALHDCYDPAFAVNIVDLGLVQSVEIVPDPSAPGSGIPGVPQRHKITVSIILATPADSEQSLLPAIIANRLAAFEAISRTSVEILTQPLWTPDRISPEGRLQLAANLKARRPADALIQIKAQSKA